MVSRSEAIHLISGFTYIFGDRGCGKGGGRLLSAALFGGCFLVSVFRASFARDPCIYT